MTLRPDEAAWLKANPGRCEECGHLTVLHRGGKDEGCTVEPCRCSRDGRPIQRCRKCGEEAAGSPKDCWRCCPKGPCKKCGKPGEHQRFLCHKCQYGMFADALEGFAEEVKRQLNQETFAATAFTGESTISFVTPPPMDPEILHRIYKADAEADREIQGVHEGTAAPRTPKRDL